MDLNFRKLKMGHYLTLVSILKNELDYIEDFIKYHRYVGVEKFIFYDREFHQLHNLVKNEPDIEVIHFPEPRTHAQAWMEGIAKTQHHSFWTAFIDADQALVPEECDSVKEILNNYHGYASLQINWHT